MSVFDNPAFDDHEKVLFCHEAATGLRAIIAIHSTHLGPSAGGCRLWSYASNDDAVRDALRLSQGMSYKNAMADLPLGGGKAVIIRHEDFVASDALFERFGEAVDTLGGAYITAEDMGMSEAIMQTIATRTRYVSGLPRRDDSAGGDPSPTTAVGLRAAIETAVAFKLDKGSIEGLTVAVQGVGNVGYNLCRLLHERGVSLVIADMDASRVERAASEFGARVVGLEDILSEPADVLAPCATGGVLNSTTIPKIAAGIVAGGANNQLETPADGQRLFDAGILFAPDYVINSGGIISVYCEYHGGFTAAEANEMVLRVGPRLLEIFERSASEGRPPDAIADREARRRIGRN